MLVPVVVRSKSGYVEGLARDDFRVWVDGRQVAIESFDSGADARVSLIFLQDLSGSMATGGKLEAGRAALSGLVAAERPGDELALVSFAGGRLAVDVPFTGDRDVFAEAMADWSGYGTTAIHDAVAWIPEISDEGRQPKRAVVLVTDGVDNASELAPEVARQAVENARLPVYVFGLGDHGDPLRPEAGAGVDTYAQVLGRLATASGGRYFPISDPADVGDAVATLLQDLRAQYVLGFPAATDAGAAVPQAAGGGRGTRPRDRLPHRLYRWRARRLDQRRQRLAEPSMSLLRPQSKQLHSAGAAGDDFCRFVHEPKSRRLKMKRWTLLAGVALALVASGCATKKYTRETVESETKPIHSRMDEIQGQVEKSQTRIDQVDAEGKQTQQQVAQVSKTAQDALDRADKAGKLAEGKLLYEKVLTDEKAHFPVDSSKISDEAAAALDEFAQRLKAENKNVYLEIQGHTDATGSESYNEKLGLQRAEAVRNYLNMKHQIPLHRMSVISYGESEPIADNKTREGRSQNRRVTIVVLA